MSSFSTLSELTTAVNERLTDEKVVLTDPAGFYDRISTPIAYGDVARYTGPQSGEVQSKNGRPTRSRVQVVITRFGLDDGPRAGRYELVMYVA